MCIQIHRITEKERARINALIQDNWYTTTMVTRGKTIDMTTVDGFYVSEQTTILGLITYRFIGDSLEILSLDSFRENQGIGTALLECVSKEAERLQYRRIRLITTNDNLHALAFYQKRGFDLCQLYRNALDISRKLKPEIPMIGDNGIPLKHEIELERIILTEKSPDLLMKEPSDPANIDCDLMYCNQHFRYRAAAIIVENGSVLFVGNANEPYLYSIGGGVHLGETAEEAVVREVYEETGVLYEVDHLAVIHENFFHSIGGTLDGTFGHEIAFYYVMKPRGTQETHSNSYTCGAKEEMHWIPIEDLDRYTAYPAFMKEFLTTQHSGIEHIVTKQNPAKAGTK